MFVPKTEIEVGTRVALRTDTETDMGLFTAGHEFNVYNIGASGSYYDLDDDDGNLLSVYTDYNAQGIDRLKIYPCLVMSNFDTVRTLFRDQGITFSDFDQYTRQKVKYHRLNTGLCIDTILESVQHEAQSRINVTSCTTLYDIKLNLNLVFVVNGFSYELDFDDTGSVIIEQKKIKEIVCE